MEVDTYTPWRINIDNILVIKELEVTYVRLENSNSNS